jgi:hypothetical protein
MVWVFQTPRKEARMASIAHWRRYVNTTLLSDPVVSQVLSPEKIEACCRQSDYHWRNSFWSPTLTVLTFMLQVGSAEKTLRAAVATLLNQLRVRGEADLPSPTPRPTAKPASACPPRC